MKIYSEKTNKEYKTVEDCLAAEKSFDTAEKVKAEKKAKLAENRKNRAKEVEDAYKNAQEAQRKYIALRNDFIRDYGSFHMTFSDSDNDFINLIDSFLSFL